MFFALFVVPGDAQARFVRNLDESLLMSGLSMPFTRCCQKGTSSE
jgi:hypothetical protein